MKNPSAGDDGGADYDGGADDGRGADDDGGMKAAANTMPRSAASSPVASSPAAPSSVVSSHAPMLPAASSRTIWWHVYPLGFTGAPIRSDDIAGRRTVHRLTRIIDWLDYLRDLGCDGLLLGPIFQSATHGYDTVDYYSIDSRLGDEDDFRALARACHAKGIALMLDGVFNHVGIDNPLFRKELSDVRAGAGSDGADATGGRLFSIVAKADGTVDYPVFEGHGDLPEINHDGAAAADLVGDVMDYWMDRGADAWRLDAAYAVPTGFWRRVLPGVRARHHDAWFLGEVIHGDYPTVVQESGMDSVTQYELWKAVWSSLQSGNFYELDWCLKRHNGFLDHFIPQTFIGNHDVTRIASTVGFGSARLAAVILFTVGGIPSVYYGDEIAMTGIKEDRLGGDDAVRPEFPERPEDMAMGREAESMRDLYRALIRMRRDRPWLSSARTVPVEVDNRRYVYDVVGSADSDAGDDGGNPGYAGDGGRAGGENGESLRVTLALDPEPTATIRDAKGVVLSL